MPGFRSTEGGEPHRPLWLRGRKSRKSRVNWVRSVAHWLAREAEGSSGGENEGGRLFAGATGREDDKNGTRFSFTVSSIKGHQRRRRDEDAGSQWMSVCTSCVWT
ncbi:uncharacterized protein CIMG_07514 [Coccidioides immitis RS]|uniref:Uncharacterized protein n=3 Tax=Coccidioides immitis TaxID=5501 RepID=J3K3J7_COCIM|nr:uncharacterized protein CIMG_07514 [Coccidioides immitis RS]EAS28768.3 hypothetical protein CIMG_07514 [Coccidioides immitis RS]KMP05873.1 hypothetical protein CIRG_05554 [Coccidioides immitis RMSCC 2394]KMU80696.1 hypothetical protein CISG_08760 [Coccidioides immitis RMSCC 3703]